jgi:hypothetical protein
MIAECDLDPGCGGEIMNTVLAPLLRILPERDPASIRVNVTPGPEGSLYCGVPRIGLAALGEVLFALPTAVITPADLPPAALAVIRCGIELGPAPAVLAARLISMSRAGLVGSGRKRSCGLLLLSEPGDEFGRVIAKMPPDATGFRADSKVAPLESVAFGTRRNRAVSSTVHKHSIGSFMSTSLLHRLLICCHVAVDA